MRSLRSYSGQDDHFADLRDGSREGEVHIYDSKSDFLKSCTAKNELKINKAGTRS